MARRKISPLFLLLFALLLHTHFISSNSTTLTSIPSWPSSHQLQTNNPDYNVVADDDGVPELEPGETPAKDPQIIVEGPLPTDTPEPMHPNPTGSVDDGEVIDFTPIPSPQNTHSGPIPKPEGNDNTDQQPQLQPSAEQELDSDTPSIDATGGPETQSQPPSSPNPSQPAGNPESSNGPKPSAEPVSGTDQQNGSSGTGNSGEQQSWNPESSPELEEEAGTNSDATGEATEWVPELSASPNEPSEAPVAWHSPNPSTSSKAEQSNSLKPSPSAAVASVPKPVETPKAVQATSPEPATTVEVPGTSESTSGASKTGPEPSIFEFDGADTSLPPTAIAPSQSLGPTAALPTPEPGSGSEWVSPAPLKPSTSLGPTKNSVGPTPAPTMSYSAPPATVIEDDELVPSEEATIPGEGTEGGTNPVAQPTSPDPDDVVLDDSYSCIFFGEGDVSNFSTAKPELFTGTVDIYTAGVSFGTLPPQYLSHTFGTSWKYSLPTNGSVSYDIVLGFAEIYAEACNSDAGAGFRLFSVSVGSQSVEVDVMGTVGCGKALHKMFRKVSPQNGVITLHFETITQNAMLSTMCYRESEAAVNVEVHETPTPSILPEPVEIKATPAPEFSPDVPSPASSANAGSNDTVDDELVQPNAKYTCVNFAARPIGNYQLFDESSMDGSYVIYKGSGVAPNPNLPLPYRYHVHGEKWKYHLNVLTSASQNVVLGFAEVFPKACASGKNGSFRVFTVSVGENFQIVDVMKSSGCGVVKQVVFENIKPTNQVIDLNLSSISGKAMLSVACYGDANAPDGGTAVTETSEAGTSDGETAPTETPGTEAFHEEMALAETPEDETSHGETALSETPENEPSGTQEDHGASNGNSDGFGEHCFQFGDTTVANFTNFALAEADQTVQVYTDEFATVSSTSDSDVYKSHIFGAQFIVTLDVGSSNLVTVEFGFAEIYEPGCFEGFRVFTVQAGAEIRTVDVFKEVGCNAAFTLQLQDVHPNIIGSGKIDIIFKAITNFAMVSSVCVIKEESVSGSGTPPSLVSISGTNGVEESPMNTTEESTEDSIPTSQTPPPYDEESPEQSTEPDVEDDPNAEQGPPQESPSPEENGLIVVDSTDEETYPQGNPSKSPYPRVNGVIDATITVSPAATASPTALGQPVPGTEDSANSGEGEGENDDPVSSTAGTEDDMHDEEPHPSDELLESGFSQTTIGENPQQQTPSPWDPTIASSGPSSKPGLSGASGSENTSPEDPPVSDEVPYPSDELLESGFSQTTLGEDPQGQQTPSPWDPTLISSGPSSQPGLSGAVGSENTSPAPSPIPSLAYGYTIISPTRTPIPTVSSSPSTGGGNDSVTDKQSNTTIEAPSPSPTGVAVEVEAPSPSSSGVDVTIEAPSPSASSDSVTITGTGPGASVSSAPTPTPISAAAFSPVPSASVPVPSPSTPGENGDEGSTETPQPLVTAIEPDTSSPEPPSEQSASPMVTSTPPVEGTPDGIVILPAISVSPGPQGDPGGSGPAESASPSPPPAATISQNQIIVIPSPSATAIQVPTRTPTPVVISPSPLPSQVATGSAMPESSRPSESPIPDVVANPSREPGSSPRATPSPSRATSPVGSSEVIVDSPTSAPSPDPVPSISVGGPDEGPVEVADNSTETIEVTGDIGGEGSDMNNRPSILVGEYKDVIATTPAGSGFAIGMGIFGSLLVLLLLVCLFFAIFRGGGAAYSYSSGYSSHKRTDYDPSQGQYNDDLGLGPAGYGSDPSYGQNTQDGYGPDPVTFETRPDGQAEAYGYEMTPAEGLGAPDDAMHRNEEPGATAEYSGLNLQQASGYDAPLPETAEYGESRGMEMRQSTSHAQFSGSYASQVDKARNNNSYGSNPGGYTFTDTFTMPNTEYPLTQRDRGYEDYRDSRPTETEPQFRGSNTMQDSFNGNHSIARPMMQSESSGNQERDPMSFTYSKIIENPKPAAEDRIEVAPSTQDGVLVDDVRSSLLDSEQASSYMLYMGSNPTASQSSYETELRADTAELDPGNVIERNFTPSAGGAPSQLTQTSWRGTQPIANEKEVDTELLVYGDKTGNGLMTGAMTNSAQTHTASGSGLPSSASNDEPWPWWWSGEKTGQYQGSPIYANGDHRTEEKENSPISSNSMTNTEGYQHSRLHEDQKVRGHVSAENPATARSAAIETNQRFVPDSSWRRQYSSTSDEEEEETTPNSNFDELRRRREPYVRSVANRLSVGPGSFSTSVSDQSGFAEGKPKFAGENGGEHALGYGRDISSWITRDPVEV